MEYIIRLEVPITEASPEDAVARLRELLDDPTAAWQFGVYYAGGETWRGGFVGNYFSAGRDTEAEFVDAQEE